MDEDLKTGGLPGGSATDRKDSTNEKQLRWFSMPPKDLEFHAASNNSCNVVTKTVVRTIVDGKEQVEHYHSVDVKTDGDFGSMFDTELSPPRRLSEMRKELENSTFQRSSFGSCKANDCGDKEQEVTRSLGSRRGVKRHTFNSTAMRRKEMGSASSVKYSWTKTGDDNASAADSVGDRGDAGDDPGGDGVGQGGGAACGGGGSGGVSAESLASPRDRAFMSRLNEHLRFGEKLPTQQPSARPASFLSPAATAAAAAEAPAAAAGPDAGEQTRWEGSRSARRDDEEEETGGQRRSGPLMTTKKATISIPRLRLMWDSERLYQEYRTDTIVQTLLRQQCHDGQGSSELHGKLQKMVAAITLDDGAGGDGDSCGRTGSIGSISSFASSGFGSIGRRSIGYCSGIGYSIGSLASIGSSSVGSSSPAAGHQSVGPKHSAKHSLRTAARKSLQDDECAAPSPLPSPRVEPPVHPAPSPVETPRLPEKGPLFEFWHTLPEVQGSGLLSTMSQEQIKLQEAMFELITSEASYVRSLRVATEVFIENPELTELLQSSQRHFLFSNLHEVKAVSERMLSELEERLGQSVEISDVCDIVYEHAANNFHCYVKYITNQPYQERALRSLSNETPQFSEMLNKLICDARCKSLPLSSFLLLPFQRITRLKLLMDNILKRAEKGTQRHHNAHKACKQLHLCIKECNDGILKMSRTEQLIHIEKTLEFKDKSVPIISHSRWLCKQGELMEMQHAQSMTLRSNKISLKPLYLFLFTDLLLFARRKDAGARFLVFEHAELTAVLARQEQPIQNHQNLLLLRVNADSRKKHKAFILKAQSENQQKRWIAAITPQRTKTSEQCCFYADCEQVCCIKPYKAREADELTLELADSLFIIRKTEDGWYEGERMSDHQCGWFPKHVVEPVASENVRQENVRERECLVASVDGGDGDSGGGRSFWSYGIPTLV